MLAHSLQDGRHRGPVGEVDGRLIVALRRTDRRIEAYQPKHVLRRGVRLAEGRCGMMRFRIVVIGTVLICSEISCSRSTDPNSGAGGSSGAATTSSDTGGTGGNPFGCCDCGENLVCTASLDCFCAMHGCSPNPWPDGGPQQDGYLLDFADCQRRVYINSGCLAGECPARCWVIDTASNTVVGAAYGDDSGACNSDARSVSAGEPCGSSLPGCTLTGCQPFGGWTCPP